MSDPLGTVSNMRSTGEGSEPSETHQFGDPAFTLPEVVADAVAAVRAVAAVDVKAESDDDLLGRFDGLETLDRLLHSARFEMLAELDARSLTDRRLGHVTANEAGWRHGTDPRRVKTDQATATTLRRHFPDLAAALAAGTVSADRVRVLARLVNDRNAQILTSIQDQLIDLCRQRSTFKQFTRDAEQLARLADADGPEPPQPRNHARLEQTGDHVTATVDLYGTDALSFAARLQAETNRLFREHQKDQDNVPSIGPPMQTELMAQAFLNLTEAGAAHRHPGRRAPAASFSIVIDATGAELADLFHHGVLLPGPGAPIDWSTRARLIDGHTLRYATREWELLTCDAEINWTITDNRGHPIASQPGERHATPEQRRNLELRDAGCVFPGCDAPANWCDAHHVVRHVDDGPTQTPNLALLCRRHHGVVHRHGWTMTENTHPGPGDGHYLITTPTGTTLHTQHRRPAPA